MHRFEFIVLLLAGIGVLVLRSYMPVLKAFIASESAHTYDPMFLDVLKQNSSKTAAHESADIVLPKPSQPSSDISARHGQVVVHVSNDAIILDRNRMWRLFMEAGGREYARQYIPEIFLVFEDSATDDFETFLIRKSQDPTMLGSWNDMFEPCCQISIC